MTSELRLRGHARTLRVNAAPTVRSPGAGVARTWLPACHHHVHARPFLASFPCCCREVPAQAAVQLLRRQPPNHAAVPCSRLGGPRLTRRATLSSDQAGAMPSMVHRAAQRRATASGGGPQPFERAAGDLPWNNGPGPLRQGSDSSQLSPVGSGELQRGWSVDLSDPSDSASGAAASPTAASRAGSGTSNGGSGRTVFSGRAAPRHNLHSLPEGLAELGLGASPDDGGSRPQSRQTSETSQSRLARMGSDEPKVQVALDALAAGLVAGAGAAGTNGSPGHRRVGGSRSMYASMAGSGPRGSSAGAANGGGSASGTLGGLTRAPAAARASSASTGSPQPASTAARPASGARSPSQARAALSPGLGGAAPTPAANGVDSPLQALGGLGGAAVNSRGLALRRQLKEEDFSAPTKREEWVVPGAAQPRKLTAVTPPRAREDTFTAREGLVKAHAALFNK